MNQFKEDLNKELQSITLSAKKEKQIISKLKSNLHNEKRRVHWQYRFVLATFTVFALGFSYLLTQQKDSTEKNTGATYKETVMNTNWSILNNDLSKSILLIIIFIIAYSLIKQNLNKNRKGLPLCTNCGEEWTYKKALKVSMTSKEVLCPNCHQKQYRTKKSSLRATKLNFFIPFITIIPLLFDNGFFGIILYISCTVLLICSLNPFISELQGNDSSNDPLW